MNIGIIGSGNMGTNMGRLWYGAGHDVLFSFSRKPNGPTEAAAAAGPSARAGTVAEAVKFGDVVLLTVPWAAVETALSGVEKALTGKILISCNNPLKPDLSGLSIGTTTSGAEEVAMMAPGARVIEVLFPFAEQLESNAQQLGGPPPTQFFCGDDQLAKIVVADLIADLGLDPVDTGPLTCARYLEPFGMLLTHLAYKQGFGPGIGARLVRGRV